MMHKKVMLLAIVSLTGVGLVYFIFDLGTVDTYKDRSDASNTMPGINGGNGNCEDMPNTCSGYGGAGYRYGSTNRSLCLHANAVVNQDVGLCEVMSGAEQRAHCASEDQELHEALRQFGAGGNFQLDDRDKCFSDLAFIKKDRTLCSAISNSKEKSVCTDYAERDVSWPSKEVEAIANNATGGITERYRVIVGLLRLAGSLQKALSYCDVIPDDLCVNADDVGQLKDSCIAAAATEYSDIDTCFTIVRKEASCSQLRLTYARANCIADNIEFSGGPISLCDEIIQPQIRETCYLRAENAPFNSR